MEACVSLRNFTMKDLHILRCLSLRRRVEDFYFVGKLKTVTNEIIEEKTIKKKKVSNK